MQIPQRLQRALAAATCYVVMSDDVRAVHSIGATACLNADRFLPDKAIDLVDEAAARLKMEATSKPEALDEIERKVSRVSAAAPPALAADSRVPTFGSRAHTHTIPLPAPAHTDAGIQPGRRHIVIKITRQHEVDSNSLTNCSQVRQLEMERFSLAGSGGGDRAAADRLAALDAHLADLQAQQKVRANFVPFLSHSVLPECGGSMELVGVTA